MKKYIKLFEEFIGTNKEVKDNEAFKSLEENADKLRTDKRDARIKPGKEDGIGVLAESIKWTKKDDDLIGKVNKTKFVIYKGDTKDYILQVNGKNKTKGTITICKAAAEDVVKKEDKKK